MEGQDLLSLSAQIWFLCPLPWNGSGDMCLLGLGLMSMAVRPGRPLAWSCWRVFSVVAVVRVALVIKYFKMKFQSAS